MRCTMHPFPCAWLGIYALGVAAFTHPLVVIPACFALVASLAIWRWTQINDTELAGPARVAHAVLVGGVLAFALVGIASASTGMASASFEDGEHVRAAPLAVFFAIVAGFAWRALVRPIPRRTAALALAINLSWVPLVAWTSLRALGDLRSDDWQAVATPIAQWFVIGAGGVLCWLATRGRPQVLAPARLVRRRA